MTPLPLPISTQPALRLATANMTLLLRFTTSPEVMARAAQANRQLLAQASATTWQLMQTGAFAQLMQGMMKNYVEFFGTSMSAARSG